MGRFSTIRETKITVSGAYFEPGSYRIKIKSTQIIKSSQTPGKEFWINETVVLASDNEDIKVGETRSQVIPMDEVMTLPNIKSFIAAASGVDPLDDEVNAKVEEYWSTQLGQVVTFEKIADLVAEMNPLEDLEMGLECIEIITRKKQPFTKHNWQIRKV